MLDSTIDQKLQLLDDARRWNTAVTVEYNTQPFLRARAPGWFPVWLRAAREGDASAMLLVADAYLEGIGVGQDKRP